MVLLMTDQMTEKNSTYIVVVAFEDGSIFVFPYHTKEMAEEAAHSVGAVFEDDEDSGLKLIGVCQSMYDVDILDVFVTRH